MVKKRKSNQLLSNLWRLSLSLVILFLIIDGYLFFDSKFFEIKNIQVNLDKKDCTSEEDIKKISEAAGKNIFFVDIGAMRSNLRQKFLCLKEVKLSRKPPNGLIIDANTRTPQALLIISKSEESSSAAGLVVDEDGIIFSKNLPNISVPKIYLTAQDLTLGSKLDEGVVKNAINILNKLKRMGMEIKEAKIYSQTMLFIDANPKIYFSLEASPDFQLASLQLILTEAKIKEEVEFIDLRYSRPIIKYVAK